MRRDVHLHSHPSRVEHWRHLAEIIALTVAAAWGFYVFVYQERIKPEHEPALLGLTWSVDHTPVGENRELIKVHSARKNEGASTIYIAGAIENIYGIRFARTMNMHATPRANDNLDRALLPQQPVLLYASQFVGQPFGNPNNFVNLQPNTTMDASIEFALPKQAFDAVEIRWQLCFTKRPNSTWDVSLKRRPDGSFFFDDPRNEENAGTGLVCYDHWRGEYYAL